MTLGAWPFESRYALRSNPLTAFGSVGRVFRGIGTAIILSHGDQPLPEMRLSAASEVIPAAAEENDDDDDDEERVGVHVSDASKTGPLPLFASEQAPPPARGMLGR